MDLPSRVYAAQAAGFEAVEILFPYDIPAPELRRALDLSGLPLALINCPPPNYTGGNRGFAAVPADRDRFRTDFRRALRYAQTLKAQHLHIMSGVATGDDARACLIDNLTWACAESPDQSLTIEPINPVDMPGYFLNDFDLAADIIRAVNAPNLGLQFDAYHAHRITGDVMGTWAKHRDLVRHVQFADHPGRHEPGRGEIDLTTFFAQLDTEGYDGWAGAEYAPSADPDETLSWMLKSS
ncbi:hydroxypyruvate isomerase family protein [Pseudooceanicola sp. MF1-13]|uniref:hydroxypyruvate isomerase family protein n=1 Tax=Pseudooceanicola sp. MF1-13 TaxID=3379095 RepID=UPI0038923DE0